MNIEHGSDLMGQREQRIQKLAELRKLGIDPYPTKAKRTHSTDELLTNYSENEGREVTVTGRLIAQREHGEIQFIDLQDDSGRIQIYIRNDEYPEITENGLLGSKDFGLLDAGDHIEVTGVLTKTRTGQISVQPKNGIRMLSKALRPLPTKWGGIQDIELRFRRRYLDMTLDAEIRERFKRRSIFWSAIREFLNKKGFYEVNIPVLEHTTGGADARPFVTHYDVLNEDFYLRISHELPLKRLLGGGFEKVYDIGARFRNEGFSDEHLPEHIAMEWYWAYADYNDGMIFTEELFKYVIQRTFGTLNYSLRGFDIDLDQKWDIVDFSELMSIRYKIDIFEDSVETLQSVYEKESDLSEDLKRNRTRIVDALWKNHRKEIGGPLFVTGIPKFLSPLSKTDPSDSRKTERFFPIIAGTEMANGFSELNDPVEQLDRFVEQQKMRDSGDDEAHMLDIDFVEMLEYGMPPAVGFGLSERVFWVFEGVSAREGVPFPPMKRGVDQVTKEIYGDLIKNTNDPDAVT